MRTTRITLPIFAMAALFAVVSAQAQQPGLHRSEQAGTVATHAITTRIRGPLKPSPDDSCAYTFTNGSGATYINYCVTANGTLANFQSPAGVEMLNPQGIGAFEGYAICDLSTLVRYFDYNFDATDVNSNSSAAWGAPTTVSSSATAVKIERSTGDGIWTLTQTITREAGPPPYAKVEMVLKNNTATTRTPVLLRFAEMTNSNAGNTDNYQENYDATGNSAWGYNSNADSAADGGAVYGLMLQNLTVPTPASYWVGLPQDSQVGPDACYPYTADAGTVTYNEGSAFLGFQPNAGLAKNKSITVTFKYTGF